MTMQKDGEVDPLPRVISVKRHFHGGIYEIGRCVRGPYGWRFFPLTTAHGPSRKAWPTWQACLPRWVGYPDHCETEMVR